MAPPPPPQRACRSPHKGGGEHPPSFMGCGMTESLVTCKPIEAGDFVSPHDRALATVTLLEREQLLRAVSDGLREKLDTLPAPGVVGKLDVLNHKLNIDGVATNTALQFNMERHLWSLMHVFPEVCPLW